METAVILINDTGDFSLLMGIDLELYNNLMFGWLKNTYVKEISAPKSMAILMGFNGDQRWQPICFFGRGDGELQPRHCIRIPSIRKCGDGLFAAYMFCGIYIYIYIYKYMYIYICMQMEVKKLRDPEILKAEKFRCMWRSPFAPLPNFLCICSGKWGQPPLQPNTRQDELCTTAARLGMTSKGGGPTEVRTTTWSPRLLATASARHQPDSL